VVAVEVVQDAAGRSAGYRIENLARRINPSPYIRFNAQLELEHQLLLEKKLLRRDTKKQYRPGIRQLLEE